MRLLTRPCSQYSLPILHLALILAFLAAVPALPALAHSPSQPDLSQQVSSPPSSAYLNPNEDLPGAVVANSAWTTDTRNSWKTSFVPNERMRFFASISNNTTAARTAYVRMYRSGPCQAGNFWSGYKTIPAGSLSFYVESTAQNCPGTYTYTVYVTYNGATTSRQAAFTILTAGSVRAVSAWTADVYNNRKSSFNQREKIRFYGQVYNTTGLKQTAYLRWEHSGPCARYVPWEGQLTIQPGYSSLPIDQIPPDACKGTYSFTFTVFYNGLQTSVSVPFTIR